MSSDSGRLSPRLGLLSITVFGLAYMAPATVVTIFGVISAASHGTAPMAFFIATVAMTLTALSYGKLARRFPTSGSVYTYARRTLGPRSGFLAGWVLLLDYFFLPMVAWLIQATYMHAQLTFLPMWGWLVAVIVATTLVNALGIVIADQVNKVLLGLTALGLLALVTACLLQLDEASSGAGSRALWNEASSLSTSAAAAAVAAYAFLGFDALSTLGEEAREPRRDIPRGIVLTVLVGGAVFCAVSLLMQWLHPGGEFENEDAGGYEVVATVGPTYLADLVSAVIIVGGLASCVAIQAGTSRLLYAMGRDGVLPHRVFGYLHPRLHTPLFNLGLVMAVGLFAVLLSLTTAASFINFGAFLAFTLVNVCVIATWWHNYREGTKTAFTHLVLPLAGAVVDLYLLSRLNQTALLLGISWLVLGLVYLCVLTRGLRVDPPELTSEKQNAGSRGGVKRPS
ncbi:APC family permease [Streptomyces anatolicus]|uniref:APC family permease n=1 Tax=Streptomyces anatolicus TaxID=2675858 RepID=UPI0027E16C06|nr:APC family permease [Streptomyces anatolicus]